MSIDPRFCTICDAPLDATHIYIAAFEGDTVSKDALMLFKGCKHEPVPNLRAAVAVMTSVHCLKQFIEVWGKGLDSRNTN